MASKGTPIQNKVTQDPDKTNNKKKFKIHKSDTPAELEVEVDIEVLTDGNYQVERLTLPDASIKFYDGKSPDGIPIRWFTNFSIKENGNHINKSYTVTIKDLSTKLGNSRLVVDYGTGNPVAISHDGDTFTLSNGDPSPGAAP